MYSYSPNPSFNRFIHITQSPFFLFFIITFCTLSYFFWDQPISSYMQYELNPETKNVAELLTHLGKSTISYVILGLGFLFCRFILKNNSLANILGFLFLAVFIPGLIVNLLKMILGRARPVLLYDDLIYGFTFLKTAYEYHSFPSGHSSSITGLMMGLCFIFTKYWRIFIILFLLISATRVLVNAHYLSDVIAGMYLSILLVPLIHRNFWGSSDKRQQAEGVARRRAPDARNL